MTVQSFFLIALKYGSMKKKKNGFQHWRLVSSNCWLCLFETQVGGGEGTGGQFDGVSQS